jgi:predicted enzyme related to lactoylglutathione lyase
MAVRTSYEPGTFCWADLSTRDGEAARSFYAGVLGWEFDGVMATLDGAPVAAVIEQSMHPSHWNSYVSVEDADAVAARAAELGATIIEPPFDVGPAGRLSLMKDPIGAAFCVWQAGDHAGAGVISKPGALTWNHLWTGDVEAAKHFYSELFGWTWDGEACRVGERLNGSVGALTPEMAHVPPSWTVTFGVADLEATRAQVPGLGATVLVEPTEFGPGRFIAVADPTGAAVSFYAGEYDD